MKYSVGDIFVYTLSHDGSRAIVTIIDYQYREYLKRNMFIFEHLYVAPDNNSSASYYDILEKDIPGNALKYYKYYPVVK